MRTNGKCRGSKDTSSGFLRRNWHFAPKGKEETHKTLVRFRPKLEYAAPIWNSKTQLNQIVKVQGRELQCLLKVKEDLS